MNPIIATTPLTDGISNLLEVLGVWIGWGFIEILPGAIATVSTLWLFDKLKYPVWMTYKKIRSYLTRGPIGPANEEINHWERESDALQRHIKRFVDQTSGVDLSQYFDDLTNKQTKKLVNRAERILNDTEKAIESFAIAQENQVATVLRVMFSDQVSQSVSNKDMLRAYKNYQNQYGSPDQSQQGRTGGLGTYATTPTQQKTEVVQETPDINKLVIEKLGIKDSAQYYYWYPNRGETLATALSTQRKIDGYGLKSLVKASQGSGELEVKHIDVQYVPRSGNNNPRTTYPA